MIELAVYHTLITVFVFYLYLRRGYDDWILATAMILGFVAYVQWLEWYRAKRRR